jgi:membrane associated rhomboid family serine protease/Flp pilus assembly protein TadD
MRPVYQVPVVTYALIGVNVLLWLLVAAVGPVPFVQGLWLPDQGALLLLGEKFGPAIQQGQYWRLVTAMFLHAGAIHLIVNMWALLQLGTLVESLYGRRRFLILYVCSGVMGTFSSYVLSSTPGVGASGAIFGLLGVALVYSLKYRRELPRGMADRMRSRLMPVVLINLAITFLVPIIDAAAHVGGLITGIILASLTESQHASPQRRQHEVLPAPLAYLTALSLLLYGAWGLAGSAPAARPLLAATAAARRGDPNAAVQALRVAAGRRPSDLKVRFWLYNMLLNQHRWVEATPEFLAFSRANFPPALLLQQALPLLDGLTRARQGREAEAVYRRLLELMPDTPYLLNGLAYLYADVLNSNLDEAEKLVTQALDDYPQDGAMLDTLAWIYYKQGKFTDALATQQRAVQSEGENAEIRYHLGAMLQASGDMKAARAEYEHAIKLDPAFAPARDALEKLRSAPPPVAPPAKPRRGEVAQHNSPATKPPALPAESLRPSGA